MGPIQADNGPLPFGRIAFVGFGLIGGSLAMALRASVRAQPRPRALRLTAWTASGRGPSAGLASGLLDAAPTDLATAIDAADLVILAAPPLAILEHLDRLAGTWRDALGEAALTDVGSTKAAIVERAEERGLRLVGGHPMAGRETSGLGAASAALFAGRPWAIVPSTGATSHDVDAVEQLVLAARAVPIRLAPSEHDAAVAAISHVPLLTAVALVEAITTDASWTSGTARALASSGWRDATRLAAGSPEMGAGILATNAREIVPRLRAVRDSIDAWLAELDAVPSPRPSEESERESRGEPIRERLERARSGLAGGDA